jgi:hypothetical protein
MRLAMHNVSLNDTQYTEGEIYFLALPGGDLHVDQLYASNFKSKAT